MEKCVSCSWVVNLHYSFKKKQTLNFNYLKILNYSYNYWWWQKLLFQPIFPIPAIKTYSSWSKFILQFIYVSICYIAINNRCNNWNCSKCLSDWSCLTLFCSYSIPIWQLLAKISSYLILQDKGSCKPIWELPLVQHV